MSITAEQVSIEREIDEIKAFEVEGWLTEREGEVLYHLARGCSGRGAIVEIGSYKGRSTVWLARGAMRGPGRQVIAIDPFLVSGFDEFKANLARTGTDNAVIPIVRTSDEALALVNEPIELLFIDGRHEYPYIARDMELWFPKVMEGGIMAFHDTTCWPGPRKVMEDCVHGSGLFTNIRLVDSVTFAEKRACGAELRGAVRGPLCSTFEAPPDPDNDLDWQGDHGKLKRVRELLTDRLRAQAWPVLEVLGLLETLEGRFDAALEIASLIRRIDAGASGATELEARVRRQQAMIAYEAARGLAESGQRPAAARALAALLARWPGHSLALNDLGVIVHACGDADTAAALFERALAADPKNLSACQNLGELELARGRADRAQSLLAHAAAIAGEDPELAPAGGGDASGA
ncbi:MAG: class I SAM-dependent methyltransferase [Acidobacteria bacterium]|nr:class I SAM-dependent methyltransferase [Acidobacteriota bacterium]